MKRAIVVVLGVLAVGAAGFQAERVTAFQAGGGWTTLFDGSSLDGWNVLGDANWALEDDAVRADSGRGFLVTPRSYGDFELTLEFWVDEPANSGIFVRCADGQSVRDDNSYEVNIFDTRPDQTYRTGGIVHFAAPTSVISSGRPLEYVRDQGRGHAADSAAQRHPDGGHERLDVRQRADCAAIRGRRGEVPQRPHPGAVRPDSRQRSGAAVCPAPPFRRRQT